MKDLRCKTDAELSPRERLLFIGAREIVSKTLVLQEKIMYDYLEKNPSLDEMEQYEFTTFMGTIMDGLLGHLLIYTKKGVDKFDSCDISINDLFESVFQAVRMKITQNCKRLIQNEPDNSNPFLNERPPV